jgi:hydrogenase maturation protein HypF
VQGVGFRPFVHRLAHGLGLSGWVLNGPAGVVIEAEGPREKLEEFLVRLERERPPAAAIHGLEFSFLEPAGFEGFLIRESAGDGEATVPVVPDLATCPECLREVMDPADRRYRYPFANCTNCGPRYSIVTGLPYDRERTTMAGFRMCADCRREYGDPADRRFHAQPIACPACGPRLALWSPAGRVAASGEDALRLCLEHIRRGAVVAVKGLGGFQLVVDARNEQAVRELRRLKLREEKPFALMFPDLPAVRAECGISPLEERLLASVERPIVLLRRRPGTGGPGALAPSVAPGNPSLGVMLPYTPLHHLLLGGLGFAVVATSGNLSDEPMAVDETDALKRLGAVASWFLVHDRPIARPVDDSVARVVDGREQVLRRARGYAPAPVYAGRPLPDGVFAAGAHLKSAVAISVGGAAVVSQHIGDLDTPPALAQYRSTVASLSSLYSFTPRRAVADMHPDYASSVYARSLGVEVTGVQHHLAHVLALMAENRLEPPFLGVAWDGTGLGPDGTVWGGEFIAVHPDGWRRIAHLRTFPLPGGDVVALEPRRSALGAMYEALGEGAFGPAGKPVTERFGGQELGIIRTMLANSVNTPRASSAGRLFDAFSCLSGLGDKAAFEGAPAMALEYASAGFPGEPAYPFRLGGGDPLVVDWEPALRAALADLEAAAPAGVVGARFHGMLASAVSAVAVRVGIPRVGLSGGCFQSRLLTEGVSALLGAAGFTVFTAQRVPPNDGGIALGQLYAAANPALARPATGGPDAGAVSPGHGPGGNGAASGKSASQDRGPGGS